MSRKKKFTHKGTAPIRTMEKKWSNTDFIVEKLTNAYATIQNEKLGKMTLREKLRIKKNHYYREVDKQKNQVRYEKNL